MGGGDIQLAGVQTVFLDRDGVINRDSSEYVKSWDEFEFIPGSIDAIRNLTAHHFSIIVITNQSGVGRGYFSKETLDDMHRRMTGEIRSKGGDIRDIFYCPHPPTDHCGCRKPSPGMLYQAFERFGLEPNSACMVGDSLKDMECAIAGGLKRVILVKTGNGVSSLSQLAQKPVRIDYVAEDLYDASEWIIRTMR